MKKLIKCAMDALGGRVTIKIMINARKEDYFRPVSFPVKHYT